MPSSLSLSESEYSSPCIYNDGIYSQRTQFKLSAGTFSGWFHTDRIGSWNGTNFTLTVGNDKPVIKRYEIGSHSYPRSYFSVYIGGNPTRDFLGLIFVYFITFISARSSYSSQLAPTPSIPSLDSRLVPSEGCQHSLVVT